MSNLGEIRPVSDALIHADGQTCGHDEANTHFFCDFPKTPKKVVMIHNNCTRGVAAFNCVRQF